MFVIILGILFKNLYTTMKSWRLFNRPGVFRRCIGPDYIIAERYIRQLQAGYRVWDSNQLIGFFEDCFEKTNYTAYEQGLFLQQFLSETPNVSRNEALLLLSFMEIAANNNNWSELHSVRRWIFSFYEKNPNF